MLFLLDWASHWRLCLLGTRKSTHSICNRMRTLAFFIFFIRYQVLLCVLVTRTIKKDYFVSYMRRNSTHHISVVQIEFHRILLLMVERANSSNNICLIIKVVTFFPYEKCCYAFESFQFDCISNTFFLNINSLNT